MKQVVLYTIKDCIHCEKAMNLLKESNIEFVERDVYIYEKEYDLFVEATGNENIPAFLLLTIVDNKAVNVELLAPDDHFKSLEEAVIKVKEYLG